MSRISWVRLNSSEASATRVYSISVDTKSPTISKQVFGPHVQLMLERLYGKGTNTFGKKDQQIRIQLSSHDARALALELLAHAMDGKELPVAELLSLIERVD